jgi:hypothetical protein
MDARPRDTSIRLVLASVPVQALIMVATFGFLVGGSSTSQVDQYQVIPGPGTGPVVMVPVETCHIGKPAMFPDGSAAPDLAPAAFACANRAFYYSGEDGSGSVTYSVTPCCG